VVYRTLFFPLEGGYQLSRSLSGRSVPRVSLTDPSRRIVGEWACHIGPFRVVGRAGRDPVLKQGWAYVYLGPDSFTRYNWVWVTLDISGVGLNI
jgi:hypothetical protein